MKESVNLLERAQNGIYLVVLILLALLLFAGLLRAVKGPRVADRLMAGNMMGTMVMVMIAVLSLLLGQEYLLDICLIYAMVSFLAVIVLSKVYIGVYVERKNEDAKSTDKTQAAQGEKGDIWIRDVSGKEDAKIKRMEDTADGNHSVD